MIKLYGDQLFSDYIESAYDLGQEIFNLLSLQSDFEPALKPDGNIVCFRFKPEGFNGNLCVLNAEIRKKILLDARFYVVQTQVLGQVYLRVTLMNPFTEINDLNDLLLLIRELGNGIMENANA